MKKLRPLLWFTTFFLLALVNKAHASGVSIVGTYSVITKAATTLTIPVVVQGGSGDMMVLSLNQHDTTSAPSNPTVSTGAGTFTLQAVTAASGVGTTYNLVALFTCPNLATGSQSITVTFSNSASNLAGVQEYNGVTGIGKIFGASTNNNVAMHLTMSVQAGSWVVCDSAVASAGGPFDSQLTMVWNYAYAYGGYGYVTTTSAALISLTNTAMDGSGLIMELQASTPTPTFTPTSTPTITATFSASPTPTPSPTNVSPIYYPYLPVSTPNPAVTLPVYFDTFTPPVATVTPNPSAPTIANYSKYVVQNLAFALTGENLNYVVDWGQSTAGNGNLLTATAANVIPVTVPNTRENWMYTELGSNNEAHMIWASAYNTGYFSQPVITNIAQLWWVDQGPDASGGNDAVGDTVGAYGTLFSYQGVTPLVAIIDNGIAYTPTVSSWTDGKINFVIPSMATGTTQVWVHNGHGGQYGWAGPVSMTVTSPISWSGGFYYPQNYGAYGDGIHDDTAAITTCVQAANGSYGTVSCPAATYLISGAVPFNNLNEIRILGAGPSQTQFLATTNYAQTNFAGSTIGTPHNYVYLSGFAMAALWGVSSSSMASNSEAFTNWTSYKNLTWNNISVTVGLNSYNGATLTAMYNATGGLTWTAQAQILNSFFYSGKAIANVPNNVKVMGSTFYGRFDGGGGPSGTGVVGYDFSNNTETDYNTSQAGTGGCSGCSDGRFCDLTNNNSGGDRNGYVWGNTALNSGPSTYKADQNAGEWIMHEGSTTSPGYATITSATINTATISGDGGSSYNTGWYYINIASGPAYGQWARIISDSSGVLTLDRNFLEIPGSTSFALITSNDENISVGKNTKTGNGNVASTAGVEIYAPVVNFWCENNSISGTANGLYNASLYYASPYEQTVSYFNYFFNNTLASELTNGIIQVPQYNGALVSKEGTLMMDQFYYNNTITLPSQAPFFLDFIDSSGNILSGPLTIDGTVVQGTTGYSASDISNTAGTVRNINLVDYLNSWDTATPSPTVTVTPTVTPTPSAGQNQIAPWPRAGNWPVWKRLIW